MSISRLSLGINYYLEAQCIKHIKQGFKDHIWNNIYKDTIKAGKFQIGFLSSLNMSSLSFYVNNIGRSENEFLKSGLPQSNLLAYSAPLLLLGIPLVHWL